MSPRRDDSGKRKKTKRERDVSFSSHFVLFFVRVPFVPLYNNRRMNTKVLWLLLLLLLLSLLLFLIVLFSLNPFCFLLTL